MKSSKGFILRFTVNYLLAIDQLWNTILMGHPDETISSRLGRAHVEGYRYKWVYWLRVAVDTLFWFDKGPNGEGHCEASIMPLEQENFRTFTDYELWSWVKK
jgi:hypothetical protein